MIQAVAHDYFRAREPTPDQLLEIAVDAYIYAYPLVLMELTRRQSTNTPLATRAAMAPMNQFSHLEAFPDATFDKVVRPNADTLYSSLWFDVTREPLIVFLPDSGGRYHLMPMLDMWTEVFASKGSRTTGDGPCVFAIIGPDWRGELADGLDQVRSPTGVGWIIGRTNTAGPEDYPAVHRFQAAIDAAPLSDWGDSFKTPAGPVNPDWMNQPPPTQQLEVMDPGSFFALACDLMRANPPHLTDDPILDRMRQIGLRPGRQVDLNEMAPSARRALAAAPAAALDRIKQGLNRAGVEANGWRTNLSTIGTYGGDYLQRAAIAYAGLGANTPEDAIYPSALTDADGQPFSSDRRYLIHFDKPALPPVRGFWSLTLYDQRQLFADNSLNRYAVGSRDQLQFNVDGSLDLVIQRDPPGPDRLANWLPTPRTGPFTLNLRLYWPRREALEGTWNPPPVLRI